MMPHKNPYEKYKQTLHYSSFKKIIKNPKNAFYIILFDILFLVTIYYLNLLARTLLPVEPTNISALMVYSLPFILLGYLLALVIIYSFFKFIVLNFLTNLIESKNKPFRFIFGKRFLSFIGLNLIIFVSIFSIFILLNSLLGSFISQQYLGIIGLVTLILFGVIAYLILNSAHVLFIKNVKIKEIFKNIFSGDIFKSSLFVILSTIIFFAIYLLLFYIIALILNNIGIELKIANIILISITNLAYYLIHFYNRVYIYLIINKKIHL